MALVLCTIAVAASPTSPGGIDSAPQAVLAAASGDGPSQAGEYALKAAFIYNFAQFVEWPADSFDACDSPIVIAVVGDDPFRGGLERAVSDKRVRDHPFVVRYLRDDQPIDACHIAYIGTGDPRRRQSQLNALRGRPVLTIGEADRFLHDGGIIRFFIENNKVRFEVNLQAAERAGLKISSKLLKLARIYQPES
jgi:hypothetical protein